MTQTDHLTQKFRDHQHGGESSNAYRTAGEALSVNDKLKILEQRGQSDLIEIFKDWKPRSAARRRKGAPLDQRVSIALAASERAILDGEIRAIKATGQSTTLGGLIRSRAMSAPNMADWRETAWLALDELDTLSKDQKDLKNRKKMIELALEEGDDHDDQEQASLLERELVDVANKLGKLTSKTGDKRSVRLQGRMTYAESETVKFRAQRLCLTTTDYLRMLIFDLDPNSAADQHLNLDARRRFYVSIIDVADNGWGNPPGVYQCSQCESYADEISRLQERIKQLEAFGH
jgi:hypothetical protein